MNFIKKSAFIAFALATLISGVTQAAVTGIDVTAGYDGSGDNSYFTLANNSSSSFTNINFTSNGTGGSSSLTFPDLAAGASATKYFDVNGIYGFHPDYDDFYRDNNQIYTLTGLLNGQAVSATFSPTLNASGQFLAFLGNDIHGNEYDASVSGNVANISAAVPEPTTVALLGLGLLGVAASRRKSAKSTSA